MKIILIDDRTQRQIKFKEKTGFNIDDYSDIVDNYTADKYEELLEKFKNDDYDMLNRYDIIITHRSAYSDINSKVLDKLKLICKEQHKKLIFFSGGISDRFYLDAPFEFLLLNSKAFYSKNLKLFLESESKNILILAYGTQWKLNKMLEILEKITLFMEENQNKNDISAKRLRNKTDINLLANLIKIDQIKSEGVIKKEDMKNIIEKLTIQIKQQVVLDV